MQDRKEALRVRAEYALLSGRKAILQPRLKKIKSKYILEQDDVNRMKVGLSGFLAKRKRDYEEKLEKEKAEVAAAKAEWERADAQMREADEKLPLLQEPMKKYQEFWETADVSTLYGEEKMLLDWCQRMEQIGRITMETNDCVALTYDAMSNTVAMAEESPLPKLQKKAKLLHENANRFFQEQQMEDQLLSWDSMLFHLYQIAPAQAGYGRYSMEETQLAVASHSTLLHLLNALKKLQECLTEIWKDAEKEGVDLLQKLNSGESHACGLDEKFREKEAVTEEEISSIAEPIMPAMGGGLFGEVDTAREKERVLLGLNLLKKEFEQVLSSADKGGLGLLNRGAKQDEMMNRISGWERALREWQQDLKLYRKNAGNFPCALDGYELLEKKTWQFSEEDAAELRRLCQMHFQDTAERLEQTLEQVKTYER